MSLNSLLYNYITELYNYTTKMSTVQYCTFPLLKYLLYHYITDFLLYNYISEVSTVQLHH